MEVKSTFTRTFTFTEDQVIKALTDLLNKQKAAFRLGEVGKIRPEECHTNLGDNVFNEIELIWSYERENDLRGEEKTKPEATKKKRKYTRKKAAKE